MYPAKTAALHETLPFLPGLTLLNPDWSLP